MENRGLCLVDEQNFVLLERIDQPNFTKLRGEIETSTKRKGRKEKQVTASGREAVDRNPAACTQGRTRHQTLEAQTGLTPIP